MNCAIKRILFESLNMMRYQVWTDESCVYDNASREKCVDWAAAHGYEIVSLGELQAEYDAEHLLPAGEAPLSPPGAALGAIARRG